MFERFTQDVRAAVLVAVDEVTIRREAPRVGSDHLLIGVTEVDTRIVPTVGIDPASLRVALDRLDHDALVATGISTPLPAGPARTGSRGRLLGNHRAFSYGAKQALERSLKICLEAGHRRIDTTHLLAALVTAGPRDPAVTLLREAGWDPDAVDATVRRLWRSL